MLNTVILFEMRTTLSCLDPKVVYLNDGRSKVVPCGHCDVCRNSKRSASLAKIAEEFAKHKATYFVTLTYADKYLPRLHFYSYGSRGVDSYDVIRACDIPGGFDFNRSFENAYYSLKGRFSEVADQQSLSYNYMVSYDDLKPVFERLDRSIVPDVPVLNIRDVQLFLKRLRKSIHNRCLTLNLSKEHETLRYYAVGEYGPLHFRPHYHLLLFTDSEAIAEDLCALVSSCWSYGYSNSSLAGAQSASYVAGYLNSFASLPRFYTAYCRFWRPFARGSQGLGVPFEEFTNESELFADDRFDDVCRSASSLYVQCKTPRSHFVSVYGQLASFFAFGRAQLFGLCQRVSEVYRYFGYDRYGRKTSKGSLRCAIRAYFDRYLKFKIIGRKVYYLLYNSLYPADSLCSYVTWQYADSDALVERDLVINRFTSFCRVLAKFLKIFRYDLYDFAAVGRFRFNLIVNCMVFWAGRLSAGSLSGYFDNLTTVEREARQSGYSDDQISHALGWFYRLYPNDGEIRGDYRLNSDGYFSRSRRLPDYFKMKLSDLRQYFRTKIKHRELNDSLLFNSQYMNTYGWSF